MLEATITEFSNEDLIIDLIEIYRQVYDADIPEAATQLIKDICTMADLELVDTLQEKIDFLESRVDENKWRDVR